MEKLIVTLKYYEQEIRVELPMNYLEFTNCLSTMLQIPKEMINKFKIYYINSSDNKEYIIENPVNYILLLNSVKNGKSEVINIELINNKENQNEINNNQNQNQNQIQNNVIHKKEEKRDDDNNEDLLVNPYKESFYEDDIKLKQDENIKENSENILSNIENEEDHLEFSFLEEKKENDNNINNNNNININNNSNNNNNIIINKNISSYYGQNKLVDNQIRGAPKSMDFNIECNFCKINKIIGVVFYCKDCSIFFCSNCEKNIGFNHPHSYYIIRNKEQFKEISDLHNNINNHIRNPYDNNIINDNENNNNISNNNNNENKFAEFISEGTKIVEKTISNTYNSVISFFNLIPNSNNNNNINNYNQNFQSNNNINSSRNLNIKTLVERVKSQYNLGQISDDEIERAIIITKGNIDKAVELLLTNHNL